MKPAILLLASAFAALAQIGGPLPGQYPPGQYPPGTYPPGQNPNGSPIPGMGRSRRGSSNSDSKPAQQNFSGAIRKNDGKTIEMELEDTRILTIQISDSTTKPSKDLKPGDGVDVVTTQDRDGMFQAVSIKLNPSMNKKVEVADDRSDAPNAPALPPQEEERTGPPPTIMVHPDQSTSDADAPPKLKRGTPPPRKPEPPLPVVESPQAQSPRAAEEASAHPAAESVAPRVPQPPSNPRMALVERARDVAATFLDGLPNYVCQELTTRYYSETRDPSWNVIDTIGAEVVFESGKESYRNLTINGRPTKKSPEESGAWSTGEFGTILAEIYSFGSAAKFKFVQDASIIHHSSSVYDFSVDREHSAWKVSVPGQYIMPAFKGSVWIDKDGAHTLRIEMQGRDIPEDFPLITVETAVDYDYVTLGSPEKFLLPVHAEVLSCRRGSNECERNVIEFRNYHKFTGESTIKFGDQKD